MYTVSARTLAEFTHPGGSIQTQSRTRKLERDGLRVHKQVQAKRSAEYLSEVPVERVYDAGDIRLLVRGRIDGFFPASAGYVQNEEDHRADDTATIEEIKSTSLAYDDVKPREVHLAQAKLYAAMYAADSGLRRVEVHLTYVHVETGLERIFDYLYESSELDLYFHSVADAYAEHLRGLIRWREERNRTTAEARFPYDEIRKGQDAFMDAVARVIDGGEKLFVRAPTGIGKTAGALFPALKSMAAEQSEMIFYLSARTTAQANAEDCLRRIRSAGALIRSVTITAKAKICFLNLEVCDPNRCPFAEGYYERLPLALAAVKEKGSCGYDREAIETIAREFSLCPYELSLDVALLSDVVICDYNYVFDPMVALRRFFLQNDQDLFVLLIDEAHNLVDRAMDMFSARIRKRAVLAAMRQMDVSENRELVSTLKAINKHFLALKKTMREERLSFWVAEELDVDINEKVDEALDLFPEYFAGLGGGEVPQEVSDLYRSLLRFSLVGGLNGGGYKACAESRGSEVTVSILCLDPSSLLRERTDTCRASVFFSATLTPFEYFTALLDGGENIQTIALDSPFPKENLEVFIDSSFSTRYRDREQSLSRLVEYVEVFARQGNCIFFFPSYGYLEMVYEAAKRAAPRIEILAQQRGMDDLGRRDFLESFEADHPNGVLAFAVLGGVFGEGIDLVGERLVAAVIVGVGLPAISEERNLMKQYYDEKFGKGFLFAYTYPGMNRVLQAAGRVIRSGSDVGTVVFAGQRFGTNGYRKLFTSEYKHAVPITGSEQVTASRLKDKPESQ